MEAGFLLIIGRQTGGVAACLADFSSPIAVVRGELGWRTFPAPGVGRRLALLVLRPAAGR